MCVCVCVCVHVCVKGTEGLGLLAVGSEERKTKVSITVRRTRRILPACQEKIHPEVTD